MDNCRCSWRSLGAAAGVACLALTATACGSSGNAASPTASAQASASARDSAAAAPSGSATSSASPVPGVPAGLTGTAKTIATNWVTFFNPKTTVAKRESLLQDGSDFTAQLKSEAASSEAQLTSSQVSAVTVTSGTAATVTWSLLFSGSPVLAGQKGTAVYQDGVWKVSKASFCGLLSLNAASGPVPAACPS
jgi:hypothetical protein